MLCCAVRARRGVVCAGMCWCVLLIACATMVWARSLLRVALIFCQARLHQTSEQSRARSALLSNEPVVCACMCADVIAPACQCNVIKVLLGAGLLVGVSVLGLLRALAMTAILMCI